MKLYLAGPMRGYADFNFPLFRRQAMWLRLAGYDVVSPVDIDKEAGLDENSPELPTKEYMKRDLPRLLECDGVVLLEGWENSIGALVEAHVAQSCGLGLYRIGRKHLIPIAVDIGLVPGEECL